MSIVDFLFGTKRLSFCESERTKVYRHLLALGIRVTHVKASSDRFTLRISRKDARRLLDALKIKEEISPSQETALGLPHLFVKLISRSGLILGGILGLALLLFCRTRIWQIDVSRCREIDPDLIYESLAECGLSEGISIRSVDFEQIAFEMLEKNDHIAWMQIRREGVSVIVDWLPKKSGEAELDKSDEVGANLIAMKDAIIVDLLLEEGSATVSVGSVVRAGDLLVSGVKGNSACYAKARIIGRVTDQLVITVPTKTSEVTAQNAKAVGFKLNLFGHGFTFGKESGDFTECETLYLFDRIRVPIFWEKVYQADYIEASHSLSEREAAQTARQLLANEIEILLGNGELLSSSVSGKFENDAYILQADLEYLINIAKTLEFSIKNE